jgi:flagellin-like protein
MKLFKSKKALSPVVASIILIAVTVAVSIAVAAWMGALTIGFMGSSSLTITNTAFGGQSANATNYISITLKNTGTKTVTLGQIKINNIIKSTLVGNLTLAPGDYGRVIRISNVVWVNGNPYKIDLFDSSGSAVGSTQENSPGS